MMSCEEFTQQLSDYLDEHVGLPKRFSFWMHLAMCSHCRRYIRQMRIVLHTSQQLQAHPEDAPKVESMTTLLQAFANQHQQEG